MSLIDKFFRTGQKQTQVVTPDGRSKIPLQLRAMSALTRRTSVGDEGKMPKRGMWVVYGDETGSRVGILTDLAPGDIASVALVDGEGLNLLQINCNAASLRQAYFEEIPPSRRPDREDTCATLGYTRAPA